MMVFLKLIYSFTGEIARRASFFFSCHPPVFRVRLSSPKGSWKRWEGVEESVSAGKELTCSLSLYSPQKEA